MGFVYNSLRKGLVFDSRFNAKCDHRGVSIFNDTDMEAPGVGSWSPVRAPIVTKQTPADAVEGTRVVRIARNAINSPSIYQNCTIAGSRIRMTGWARGDGANAWPRVLCYYEAWKGTTSNSWQEFTVDYSGIIVPYVNLQCSTVTPGAYVEFDNIRIWEAFKNFIDRAGGISFRVYNTPTGSSYTTFNGSGYAYSRNGYVDSLGTRTIALNFYADNIASTGVFLYFATANPNDGMVMGLMGGLGRVSAAPNNGGSKFTNAGLASTTWYRMLVTKTAGTVTGLYINGLSNMQAATGFFGMAPQASIVGASYSGGSYTAKFSGRVNNIMMWDRALSADEITADYALHGM